MEVLSIVGGYVDQELLALKAAEIPAGTIYAGSPARKIGNTEENIGRLSASGSRPISISPNNIFMPFAGLIK